MTDRVLIVAQDNVVAGKAGLTEKTAPGAFVETGTPRYATMLLLVALGTAAPALDKAKGKGGAEPIGTCNLAEDQSSATALVGKRNLC